MRVRQDADGRYYVDPSVRADFRLVAYVGFVGLVLIAGMVARWYLVNRYRLQLEAAARTR